MTGGNGDDDAPETPAAPEPPEIGAPDSPGGHHEYAPIGEPTENEIYVPNVPVYTPEIDAPGTGDDSDGSSGNW
jgi:hypothetical protein